VKILLPVDQSPFSEEAIREVEDRFQTSGAKVRVLHAVPKFVPPAVAFLTAGGTVEAARAQVVDQYSHLVGSVTARLQAQGISAAAIVKEGDPRKVRKEPQQ
jgi:nucleotide-binding universal stress UspA family protein